MDSIIAVKFLNIGTKTLGIGTRREFTRSNEDFHFSNTKKIKPHKDKIEEALLKMGGNFELSYVEGTSSFLFPE